MSEMTKKEKTFKVLGIVGNVLLWVLVAFSILTTIFVMVAQKDKDGIPQIFGKSVITIQTDSMSPTYEKGDLVFVTRLSPEEKQELKVDDIITFYSPEDIDKNPSTRDLNTHRIYEIDGDFIYTIGDAVGHVDADPIGRGEIIGVCTEDGKIKGIGGVLDFLRSSLGFFLCVVLPMLLFFLYELYNFISLLVARRVQAEPVSKETEEEIKRRAIEEYLLSQGMEVPADISKEPTVTTGESADEETQVDVAEETPKEDKKEDDEQA